MLIELPVSSHRPPFDPRSAALVAEGLSLVKSVDCFDFVPSDYATVYGVLSALPRGRFCVWGSGLGVITGLASILGFSAMGIEIDEALAEQSRGLLKRHGIDAPIVTGDYFECSPESDYYFTYCWPSRIARVEDRIESFPHRPELLICYGAEDVRRKQRSEQPSPDETTGEARRV